ncbi:MAG: MBL fold metallo-hydrolase [Peptococcaceae bacterium]|nr:MBL fold metallo-hydrolase [Peptococcaceae bacterium]
MRIYWKGHACFLIECEDGINILTDPFNNEVGYPIPQEEINIVTVSHQHFDHNAVDLVKGSPHVIQNPGVHTIGNKSFEGIPTFHDKSEGKERGTNIVFLMNIEGVRLCHLGDLGHLLEEKDTARLANIDVLFIPVGGHFTIDALEASKIVAALKPKITVPMHYKTEYLDFPISPVENFTKLYQNVETRNVLEVDPQALPQQPKTIVLNLQTSSID